MSDVKAEYPDMNPLTHLDLLEHSHLLDVSKRLHELEGLAVVYDDTQAWGDWDNVRSGILTLQMYVGRYIDNVKTGGLKDD